MSLMSQWLPKMIDTRCAFTIQYGDTCSEFTDFNEAQETLFGSVPGEGQTKSDAQQQRLRGGEVSTGGLEYVQWQQS